MKSTIIVTGADGQLGKCLKDMYLSYKDYEFVFTDINELDITKESDIESYFAEKKPSWVVNCAAYTAVDAAENDEDKAMAINGKAVENIARQSEKIGAKLVHISTDYVFDGKTMMILTEEMEPNPINAYGRTKLFGEKAAELNPQHIIFRTSWLYSQYGVNFVKTVRRLATENSEISIVADQWGSPTSASDLAAAIMSVIAAVDGGKEMYGMYNYSNEGATCWADFAEQIIMLSHLECKVNHITTAQYPTAAERPLFSVLSKNKFKMCFNQIVPEWESSLEEVISKF
ncbi:MAG: dTDP-4-dehydrorhamnose reductase [Rikenellaceae bacterium]